MIHSINRDLFSHKELLLRVIDTLTQDIENIAKLCIETLENNNKILLCGNGGSAADAQHIASELTGKFQIKRKALSAIALSTDSSAITAIGNDFGFEYIFSRQIEAIAKEGDLLIAITTSGNSKNILEALKSAKEIGCKSVSFLGKGGGEAKNISDISLIIPSNDTPRIQEMHILIGHIICQLIDKNFEN